MMPRERNAALSRTISRSRQMHENGAPGPLNPRSSVVVQYDDHIVKTILPPQAFGARRIRVSHGSIIVSVADGITPSIVNPQGAHRQPCPGTPHAIGAIEHQKRSPDSAGRGTVTLALAGRSPSPPQGTRQHERSHEQKATCCRTPAPMNTQRMTMVRHLITGIGPAPTPDCHPFSDSCIHWATSDMLHPQNLPIRSVAT